MIYLNLLHLDPYSIIMVAVVVVVGSSEKHPGPNKQMNEARSSEKQIL